MAVVIESHELMNKGYQSVINYGWKKDLLRLKATTLLSIHTLVNRTLTEHDFADTINLLLSIGEQTVTAINSNVPVSPFP
jgi:hypothetical protein